jgi:putative sigma-54 modulation protein
MDIKLNSVHFDADKKLENFIKEKVKKLVKFYEGILGAEVFLRLENSQEEENKVVEIKLQIPGSDIFAKRQAKTFEEATDNVVEALRQQIIKYKEKLKGL